MSEKRKPATTLGMHKSAALFGMATAVRFEHLGKTLEVGIVSSDLEALMEAYGRITFYAKEFRTDRLSSIAIIPAPKPFSVKIERDVEEP